MSKYIEWEQYHKWINERNHHSYQVKVKYIYSHLPSGKMNFATKHTLGVGSDHKTCHMTHQTRHMVTFGWYIFNNVRMVSLCWLWSIYIMWLYQYKYDHIPLYLLLLIVNMWPYHSISDHMYLFFNHIL